VGLRGLTVSSEFIPRFAKPAREAIIGRSSGILFRHFLRVPMISARLILAVTSLSAFLLLAVAGAQSNLPDDGGKSRVRPVIRSESTKQAEVAILKSAEEFAAAYNSHDAKAIAAGFSPTAEYVTGAGARIRGSQSISEHFASLFGDFPDARIRLTVESIRLIAPQAAIEEGTVDAEFSSEGPVESSRYVAVHTRDGARWQIAAVREIGVDPAPLSSLDRMRALEWLIGDWVHEDDHVTTRMTCRWSEGGSFLLQELSLRLPGQQPIQTSTRVGWDGVARQFRSWTFDSQGGFSQGRWTGQGAGWLIKSQGVTRLGRTFSATAELRQVDSSTMTLSSRDRIEGGALSEAGREITVERVPPPPEE
jgi:uncharacterized protein (TIGR02246 family)